MGGCGCVVIGGQLLQAHVRAGLGDKIKNTAMLLSTLYAANNCRPHYVSFTDDEHQITITCTIIPKV
jgi:hypothetical protein